MPCRTLTELSPLPPGCAGWLWKDSCRQGPNPQSHPALPNLTQLPHSHPAAFAGRGQDSNVSTRVSLARRFSCALLPQLRRLWYHWGWRHVILDFCRQRGGLQMLLEYFRKVFRRVRYEIIKDAEPYHTEVIRCQK